MRPATQILHAHHGAPQVAECVDRSVERCYVCACPSARSQAVKEWMGENFTGQSLVAAPSSTLVCEACVWAMAGRPPDTLRMWCHLYDEAGYVRTNKGDKPQIRDWLRGPHQGEWFAAIADSGKKHVLPFTPVNPAGSFGSVRFEEDTLMLPRAEHEWAILDETTELLTLGATKAEIEPGIYGPRAWSLCPGPIAAFEERWGRLRNSAWFRLVVWLAQRDEERVTERMNAEQAKRAKKGKKNETRSEDSGEAPNVDHGVRARCASDLSPGVRADGGAETLGSPGNGAANSDADGKRSRGMGNDRDEATSFAKPHQLGLPGFA